MKPTKAEEARSLAVIAAIQEMKPREVYYLVLTLLCYMCKKWDAPGEVKAELIGSIPKHVLNSLKLQEESNAFVREIKSISEFDDYEG